MYRKTCFLLILVLSFSGCRTLNQEGDLSLIENYYSDGTLKSEYRLDTRNRKTGTFREYYPTGVFKKCGRYKKDVLDGVLREFRENGTLKYATEYEFGQMTGMRNIYYPNETTWSKEIYNDGRIVKQTTFDEEGFILSEEYFNR